MTRRAVGTATLAGELALALDHVPFEPDIGASLWSNETLRPLDDAANLRGVENFSLACRHVRDEFDPVDGVGDRELLVFEVGEEFDAQFDGIVHTHRRDRRPQSVCPAGHSVDVMNRATRRQLVGVAVLVGIAAVAALTLSPSRVIAGLEHLATHPLKFGLALALVYLVRPFLFWPVSSIAVVLGYVYGPVVALPLALVGAGLTGLPPFAIARRAESDVGILRVLAEPGRDLVGVVGEVRGVIGARFSPVPGDVVSYAAGLSQVSLGAFLLGTVVGEIPWAIAAVLAGNSMRTLTVSGFRPDPLVLLGIAALAALVLGGPLYRHVRGGPV